MIINVKDIRKFKFQDVSLTSNGLGEISGRRFTLVFCDRAYVFFKTRHGTVID